MCRRFLRTGSAAVIAIMSVAAPAFATQPCLPEPPNLVSFWTGDDHPLDSKYGNDGMLQNGAGYAPGLVGSAFSFDASTHSGVLVPTHSTLDAQSVTLAAWVKAASFPNSFPMVLHRDKSTFGETLYALVVTATGQAHCNFANGAVTVIGGSVPLGVWTHLACTYDGSTARLYVNGSEVGHAVGGVALTPSSQPLGIGTWPGELSRDFSGLIDEPMFFNRALSAAEISDLYGAGSAGVCRPPVEESWFYSVDLASDSLVCLNVRTGQVLRGCDLGGDMVDADLAVSGASIYVLNTEYPSRSELLVVDGSSFTVTSSANLTLSGAPVELAEALAVANGTLYVALGTNPSCPKCSNAIGTLALDGTITNVVDFRSDTYPLADADGLTGMPNGHLLWWDVNPPDVVPFQDNYQLADVLPTVAGSYTVLGDHHPYTRVHDIAVSPTGTLWGTDDERRRVVQIDPATGALIASFPYSSSHPLTGMALANPKPPLAVSPPNNRGVLRLRAFPNPARRVVTLAAEGTARVNQIQIIDPQGRCIWSLLDPGSSVTWPGLDDRGRSVPEGVYLATWIVGADRMVKPFVWMK